MRKKTFAIVLSVLLAPVFGSDSAEKTSVPPKESRDTKKPVRILKGHEKDVIALAFSPDGSMLASGSSDHTARLWDLKGKRRPIILRGHDFPVASVAFSPDGKQLMTSSRESTVGYDALVKIWETSTGKALRTFKFTDEWGRATYLPDGKFFVLQVRKQVKGGYLYGIKVFNVSDGREKLELATQATPVRCFALAPDGNHVAMGRDDGKTTCWNLTTGKEENTINVAHLDWVDSLAFSPDGNNLAIVGRMAGTNDWWTIWDFKRKQRVESRLLHGGLTGCMEFSPDGKLLVVAAARGLDITSFETGYSERMRTDHWVQALAFSADGKSLASSAGKNIEIWKVETLK